MIEFPCSGCRMPLSTKSSLAGRKIKCRACGQVTPVPNTGSPPDDPSLTGFLAPAQANDELGRLGGFRILKILGHGGMGVVFQGEDPKLGRQVAIKAMLPHLAGSKAGLERFLREARAAAALEHDHIVPIFHVGEDGNAPFIVMPFLKGEPLNGRLQREGTLPTGEVLRIGREIAEGLAVAHEHGLIHRDIKPANVWLEAPRGRVKILDFGLARPATDNSHLTQTGTIMGTPSYMAPEQASAGGKIDARCDLWSLGVVLYRLCAGTLPFKGGDMMSTLIAVTMDDPLPPAQINGEVPASLSKLVMKLLHKEPARRPSSAQQVVAALQTLERETAVPDVRGTAAVSASPFADLTEPIAPPPPKNTARKLVAAPAPKRSPPRRRSLVAAGVAAALVLLLGGIMLYRPTAKGTVRIEINDPDVKVTFDKDGPTITGAGKGPITLEPGEHGIVVTRDDFTFETDRFVLKKGETVRLKIVFLDDKVQVVKDNKVIAEKSMPPARTFTNRQGMEFVLVPRGKAWLGGGKDRPGDTEVTVNHDFYLGKYPVTQGEWEKIMGQNPSRFARTGLESDAVKDVPNEELKRFPVEMVSWQDMQDFLEVLNKRHKEAGWVYRLPKEAEWEYACRGGPMTNWSESAFDFYFDRPTNLLLPEQANINRVLGRPCKVGNYQPNRLRLYDMHGNVGELCEGVVPGDGAREPQMLSRGAGWVFDSGQCRAAVRRTAPQSHRAGDLGLRLARVPRGKQLITPPPAAITEAGLEVVMDRLKGLNPGFDGKQTHVVDVLGVVTELQFLTDKVTDISPIRALTRLQALGCRGSGGGMGQLADLSPLQGMTSLTVLDFGSTKVANLAPLQSMQLMSLDFNNTPVSDLAPLKDMKLTKLSMWNTGVSDLAPLRGMKLTSLNCSGANKVSDLSPLKGMPLTRLLCFYTKVSDLSPLKGMPLTTLLCHYTPVFDLSPLKNMKLTNLDCRSTKVSDLSPLKSMPLKQLSCDFKSERDTKLLRSIKTLETINGKPAKEVLEPSSIRPRP